jgi:site-specific DNA-methyltransferase (adenine-specific)
MEGQSKTGIYHQGEEKHEWDNIVPTIKIMQIANRILRKNGKMILFAQEPFTNELMNSAIPNLPFNYRAIWLKDTLGSFMRSKKALLYKTEDILIYSKMNPKHDLELKHPIRKWLKETQEKANIFWNDKRLHEAYLESGIAKNIQSAKVICQHKLDWNYVQIQKITKKHYEVLNKFFDFNKTEQEIIDIFEKHQEQHLKEQTQLYGSTFNLKEGDKYKSNVFEFKRDRDNYHPTQKPILLLEDLIKTFSNENDLVVDLTMGSGSTGVACKNTNRNFTGIEKDDKYFEIAQKRIKGTEPNPNNFEKVEERGLFSFTDKQSKAD